MQKRIKIIWLVIFILLIAALLLIFKPYTDALQANQHMDMDTVKFLMKQETVEKTIGKGTPLGGFGADFYVYEQLGLTLAYPHEGFLKSRVGWLEVKSNQYSIYGVKPGDSAATAREIFLRKGFVQSKSNNSNFSKGNIQIVVYQESVRIWITDWTIRNHVY